MKFSEYPQKVKDLVKLRVEEQGNVFNEDVFNEDIHTAKSGGGFNWSDTIEEDDFWREVLIHEKFELVDDTIKIDPRIYSRSKYPEDASEGSKWICVFPSHDMSLRIGDVLTLVHNDKTFDPYFTNAMGTRQSINWHHFAPYDDYKHLLNINTHDVSTTTPTVTRSGESYEGTIYQQSNLPQIRCGY